MRLKTPFECLSSQTETVEKDIDSIAYKVSTERYVQTLHDVLSQRLRTEKAQTKLTMMMSIAEKAGLSETGNPSTKGMIC